MGHLFKRWSWPAHPADNSSMVLRAQDEVPVDGWEACVLLWKTFFYWLKVERFDSRMSLRGRFDVCSGSQNIKSKCQAAASWKSSL